MATLVFREPLRRFDGRLVLGSVYGTELVLRAPVPAGPPYRLVLGAVYDPADAAAPRDLTISATLPPPTASIRVGEVTRATLSAQLAPPTATFALGYDNDVSRGPAAQAASAWQAAEGARVEAVSPWRAGIERRTELAGVYTRAAPRAGEWRALNEALADASEERTAEWQRAAALAEHRVAEWEYPPRAGHVRRTRWQTAQPADDLRSSAWFYPPRITRRYGSPWEQAHAAGVDTRAPFGEALRHAPAWRERWQQAGYPPPGESQPPTEPPVEPPDLHDPTGELLFRCPVPAAPWALVFRRGHPCPVFAGIRVPVRRVYVVLNTASLTRVSDGADIPATALTAAIDVDSWAWELTATVAGPDAMTLVHESGGVPIDVELAINGETWRGVIDDWSHEREFGRRNVTFRARSLAAYLAAPYAVPRAYTETQERSAVQLAEQELPTGWTLAWQIVDWLVPAGVWSYAERTPMAAITTVAKAAGGIIQADPLAQTLHALPRYPAPHWEWASIEPDLSLPADVLVSLGTQAEPRQAPNKIYVSGQQQGVNVGVRRDGTAGNVPLPAIIDPLITEVATGQARGLAELSATGWQARERLALPLSTATGGLLTPGKLLEVTGSDSPATWRGLVRSLSVRAELSRAGLRVRQTVEAERHEEAA